jgi:hypothetical protein
MNPMDMKLTTPLVPEKYGDATIYRSVKIEVGPDFTKAFYEGAAKRYYQTLVLEHNEKIRCCEEEIATKKVMIEKIRKHDPASIHIPHIMADIAALQKQIETLKKNGPYYGI